METLWARWRRVEPVVWPLALFIVTINATSRLIDAAGKGFSTWDWVMAAVLVVLVISLAAEARRWIVARHEDPAERRHVDLDLVRATYEKDGRISAVREVRRQDPRLTLVAATQLVDGL